MLSEKLPIRILQVTFGHMTHGSLATMEPQHPYGLANRFQQVSEEALNLNRGGTIYPVLVRVEQHG